MSDIFTCPLCKGTGKAKFSAEAMPTTYIGRVLSKARREKGLSLRDVEGITNLSNAAISQIETGKIKSPAFHSIVQLCDVYGISVDKLIKKRTPTNPAENGDEK